MPLAELFLYGGKGVYAAVYEAKVNALSAGECLPLHGLLGGELNAHHALCKVAETHLAAPEAETKHAGLRQGVQAGVLLFELPSGPTHRGPRVRLIRTGAFGYLLQLGRVARKVEENAGLNLGEVTNDEFVPRAGDEQGAHIDAVVLALVEVLHIEAAATAEATCAHAAVEESIGLGHAVRTQAFHEDIELLQHGIAAAVFATAAILGWASALAAAHSL